MFPGRWRIAGADRYQPATRVRWPQPAGQRIKQPTSASRLVGQFADWFINSDLGQEEAAMHNNHATWHLVQSVAYLDFAGDREQARTRLAERATQLLDDHCAADGSQP